MASDYNKILKNEKYMGDALSQKTYTVDFFTNKCNFNHFITIISEIQYKESRRKKLIRKNLC